MTQILVTIKDSSFSAGLMNTIGKLEGVVRTSLYVPGENDEQHAVSSRIRRLRGVAKGITPQQIEEDERLSYLLNK